MILKQTQVLQCMILLIQLQLFAHFSQGDASDARFGSCAVIPLSTTSCRAFFKDFPIVGQTNERAHTTYLAPAIQHQQSIIISYMKFIGALVA